MNTSDLGRSVTRRFYMHFNNLEFFLFLRLDSDTVTGANRFLFHKNSVIDLQVLFSATQPDG